MKKAIAVVLLGLAAGVVAVRAATSPIYVNSSPVISPPDIAPTIDATAFVNSSHFSISYFNFLNPLPYDTANTQFFTNEAAGVMFGDPGYRFHYVRGNDRLPMTRWVNQGTIAADSTNVFFLTGANANWLLVNADTILNSGQLSVGSQGLLQLNGSTIDLSRSRLRSSTPQGGETGFFFGSPTLVSNYVNDIGISDLYWGTGTNNAMNNSGQPMDLTGFALNGLVSTLPFPQSPFHQAAQLSVLGGTFTNLVTVPSFGGLGAFYKASVLRTQNPFSPTNYSIQVVFTPTNYVDTNFFTVTSGDLTMDVRFFPDFSDLGATVVVAIQSVDFDIVSQTFATNTLYLVDDSAFETNRFLARNVVTTTRRPNTLAVTRFDPSFGSTNFSRGNLVYDPSLIYNPTSYLSNRVQVLYSGYASQLSLVNTPGFTTPGSPLADPTNFPGRVEILGSQVNLDRTRIRADSTLILRAGNLVSNRFALVDAPFLTYDVGSTQPLLTISNLAPATVRRFSGPVFAWSGTWRNIETNLTTTNAIDFHVLIVDTAIRSQVPVVMNEFRLRGNDLLINDTVSVGKVFRLDARGLDLAGGLTLPPGSSWGATNVLNVGNFTNRALLSMAGSAQFGTDRPAPYTNFVNTGSIGASSQQIRARNLDNRGLLAANAGLLTVDAVRASFAGPASVVTPRVDTNFFGQVFTNQFTNVLGPTLRGSSDIRINAGELVMSNAVFKAGDPLLGSIQLTVTNRLVDSGLGAPSVWDAVAGIRVLRKPATNDLLGTRARLTVAQFNAARSLWAGDDLGAVPSGFTNNLALGRLTLDAQGNLSTLSFGGSTSSGRAMYVDYIQFENWATNYNDAVEIDPGFTIYFADSNVSARKLDGAVGGRFRWVSSFAGPNSSTNMTYPSGAVYTFNRALVTSNDLDSDKDGIPNGFDATPVFVPELIGLAVGITSAPPDRVFITWNALALSTNRVEFRASLTGSSSWQALTQFVMGPSTAPVTVSDPVAPGSGQRFYRVRVTPSP